jgi:hypothetical protein
VIFYSADIILGEHSSRKNIFIVFHPVNEPDNNNIDYFAKNLRKYYKVVDMKGKTSWPGFLVGSSLSKASDNQLIFFN